MSGNKKPKDKGRYRFDIVIILSLFALLVSFCAYMTNTDLEDVLNAKYNNNIVTHEYSEED